MAIFSHNKTAREDWNEWDRWNVHQVCKDFLTIFKKIFFSLSKAHLAHLSSLCFAGNLPEAQIHSRGSISVWRRTGWTGWSMAFGSSLFSHPDPKVSRQGGSSRPELWTWLLRSLQVGKLNSSISILMSFGLFDF